MSIKHKGEVSTMRPGRPLLEVMTDQGQKLAALQLQLAAIHQLRNTHHPTLRLSLNKGILAEFQHSDYIL